MNIGDMRVDLEDMLTDWVSERTEDICPNCEDNIPEEDIGYSRCPADFDIFSCPHARGEITEEIRKAVEVILDSLPDVEM